ncbi:MAG: HlyD family efflux transporter periplasmic adaptor subunit [Coleofasciculus sp. C1-SOL-03]|jgi:multidrug efflux pump subunit AcrA (membrane-fusion protein)|uniref:HlyD family efflux transporter periplasmic adaptor subunit n=1 Tax=Coleofasciculus sp. C1-SOL-03 TaxID=3069522 RepID=UPI0032FA9375
MKKDIIPIRSLGFSKPFAPVPDPVFDSNSNDIQNLSGTESAWIWGGVAIQERDAKSQTPAHSPDTSDSGTSPTASAHQDHWSTSLQAVLDQPPSALPRYLILGGVMFSLAFVAWATFGKIDQVGYARGQLVPKGDVYKIHPVAAGKIEAIHIEEGEIVKTDQVLVELDHQIALAEVKRLEQEQASYQTELSQIQALIEKTHLETQTRAAIAQAQIKAQEAAITQAKAQAKAQEVMIAQNQVNAANQQQLLSELEDDATAQKIRLQRLEPLLEDGAIAAEVVFQREQALRDRQRTITQTEGELQQTLAESQRLQAEQQQALAQAEQLQAELTQKQAEKNTALLTVEHKIKELEVQKTQLQAKIDQTTNLLNKAKTQLKQLSLTTPVEGVVLSLHVSNAGEVVQSGQTIAEIAPQGMPLVLSASLPNQEAGGIKTGMPVKIKFDAYPYQDYGVIGGKVTFISPDTKPDEQLGEVYKIEVTLDRSSVSANGETIRLKAGQTGTAEIIVRHRRIADILLDPIRQLQEDGINL